LYRADAGAETPRSQYRSAQQRYVAAALAAVPIDNKQERDAIRARLRRKYADLKTLEVDMSAKDRRRFEELGELVNKLEACESRPPETRS
jgi:hypothetical protein